MTTARKEAEVQAVPRLPLDLIRAAELKAVRLEKVIAQSTVRSRRDVKKPKIAVNFGTKARDFADGRFHIEGRIEAVVSDEARQDKAPSVVIRAIYELAYEVPPEITPSQQDLEMFADTNAVLNVWPYWREIVQNLSMRLDLPPILLPLFRLAKAPGQPAKRAKRKE